MENQKRKYLNEENYQRGKKKILIIAAIVLAIGVIIGGSLIGVGLSKRAKVNSKYSDSSKASLNEKIAQEKQKLEDKKNELENNRSIALETEKTNLQAKKASLEAKGINYNAFTEYTDGEAYDLKIITNALDPSFNNCAFDEYKNNAITSKYCLISNYQDEDSKSLSVIKEVLDSSFDYCSFDEYLNNPITSTYCSYKQQLNDFDGFSKSFEASDSIPFYIIGVFIIIASAMFAFSIFMFAKRREILAFGAQQVIPVGKEIVEEVAPTIGHAAGTMAKEAASGIGELVKEVSNGIKGETNNTNNNAESNINNTNDNKNI